MLLCCWTCLLEPAPLLYLVGLVPAPDGAGLVSAAVGAQVLGVASLQLLLPARLAVQDNKGYCECLELGFLTIILIRVRGRSKKQGFLMTLCCTFTRMLTDYGVRWPGRSLFLCCSFWFLNLLLPNLKDRHLGSSSNWMLAVSAAPSPEW